MDQSPEAKPAAADHTNWRTRPHSTWAFQHVRELIPVADIANDPARAAPFPTRIAALDLAEFQQLTRTDGLVVMHQGRVVHEFYDAGMAAHTPHILMSATKSVVALVAGTLHGAGLLDVEAPVSDTVPDLARTAFQGATVQQLLDMRTGVVMDAQAAEAYRAATGWDPVPAGEAGAGPCDLRTFFETTQAIHEPHGGPFKYTSANTDLLGLVMERVTGQPFATIASERLWSPMGAEDPACITVDDKGAARCTGGLCATARDLARVGWMVLQQGRAADGRAVVPASWIEDMWHGGDAEAWSQGEFAAGFAGMRMRYRSGWYVVDDAPGMLFAMGIHGQHLFVDPRSDLVIAKLSSQNQPIDAIATARTLRAVGAIRRALA